MKPSPDWRAFGRFFGVLTFLAGAFAAPSQIRAQTFQNGDVFVGGRPGGGGGSVISWYHADGTLVRTLVISDLSTDLRFDQSGNLYAVGFSGGTITKFDLNGNSLGLFETGLSQPIGIVFDKAGNLFVGSQNGAGINEYSPSGSLIRSFPIGAAQFLVVSPDQQSVIFTQEFSSQILRLNLATGAVSTFGSVPGATAFGPEEMALLPDGSLLVAAGNSVAQVSSAGAVIRTYSIPGNGGSLIDVVLDPDGKSFWAGNYQPPQVFKVDIATGNVIQTLSVPAPLVDGLAVFTSAANSLPSGLVAWYPAEGNANDVVGGHNGTLVGGVTFAPGKFGQAFSLDGTSGYINAGSSPAFNLGDFTLAAWVSVNPATNTGERRVVSRDDIFVAAARQAYALKSSMPFACPLNGGAGLAIIAGGILSTVCANAPLSAGFHHLAGMRSGSTIMLYVDGVLVNSASASNAVISPSAPLVIGQVSPVYNGEFLNGLIDEVQIYNRALSASEIQTAMNGGSAPPNSPPTANAGPNQIVEATSAAGANVMLSGSGSSDPDGDVLTYTWTGPFGTATGVNPIVLMPLGTNTVSLKVDDGHGNTATATVQITVRDTTPPNQTITATPLSLTNANAASFSFSGSDLVTPSANLIFQCMLDAGSFAACTSPATYTGLLDGVHTFSVRAIDGAGNVNASPASFTWTIDTVPPHTLLQNFPVPISNNANPSFVFAASEQSTFQCSLDSASFSTCTSPATYTGLSQGSHAFQVRATDLAGNVDPTPPSFSWTIDTTRQPRPFITNIAPISKPAGSGGFTLTVYGSGFNPHAVVRWNGSDHLTSYVSHRKLTAAILASDLPTTGVARVTVFNPVPGGGISNVKTFNITVPTVTHTFAKSAPISIGTQLSAIVTADLNGDGIPDLVATDFVSGTISVLLGGPAGTFGPITSYVGAADQPTGIVIADLNGDGIPDLVFINQRTRSVRVCLGRGNGQFVAVPGDFSTSADPAGLVVGDFNGDGFLDVAVASRGSNCVSVLLGRGDGTFNPKIDYATGSLPVALATGDFNGDGIPDLAVVNGGGNSVSILLGVGDGSFGPKTDFPVSSGPTSIAIADFNGDGILDLAVASQGSNCVSVLLGLSDGSGLGTGGFGPKTDYLTSISPQSVAVADFNGDGIPDLVTANKGSSCISVLLGNGDGTFGPKFDFPTDCPPVSLTVDDLNLDGKPDVFTVGCGTVSALLNTSDRPPVAAVAAPVITQNCTSPTGTAVILDGSPSIDLDNNPLTYTWTGPFAEGGGTITGVKPTVTLPLGTSTITLVVNDGIVNSAPVTVKVTILAQVQGLLPPLAALVPDGSVVPLPNNAFMLGRTLPLRLQMFCGSTALTDQNAAAPQILTLVRNGDAVNLTTIDPDAGQANDNGLLFRYSAPNWVYNLSTAQLTSGSYVIMIQPPDGQRYDAAFVLR